MPPLEHMDLHDKAILWTYVRPDRQGQPLISSPEEIDCRWEEGQFERLDADGQEIVVDVIMTTHRNIVNGSILWEGSEEDLEDLVGASLIPTSGIYELITRNRANDIKGRVTRYEFGLKRFKNSLPTIVEG